MPCECDKYYVGETSKPPYSPVLLVDKSIVIACIPFKSTPIASMDNSLKVFYSVTP